MKLKRNEAKTVYMQKIDAWNAFDKCTHTDLYIHIHCKMYIKQSKFKKNIFLTKVFGSVWI